MTAREIFEGSDAGATRHYYERLSALGPVGVIATNLLRAQKSSARAKKYRGGIRGVGSYRSLAYQHKAWSLEQLSIALVEHGPRLAIPFGWKPDPATPLRGEPSWVIYIELPHLGQVSFHSTSRFRGPDYSGEWDGARESERRILEFCDQVFERRALCMECAVQMEMRF
jgi:hypothetical protein